MKKAFGIFAIFVLSTLPAMAGSRREACEKSLLLADFTEWPQKYQDIANNILSNPLKNPYKGRYSTGVGCTASCVPGQKLSACVTPKQHADACAKIFADDITEQLYREQFKSELCGHIPDSAEATRDDKWNSKLSYWMADKEKPQQSVSKSDRAAVNTNTSKTTKNAPSTMANKDCDNATNILLGKYCKSGLGGIGGNCCDTNAARGMHLMCNFFKDDVNPETVKKHVADFCGLSSPNQVDLYQGNVRTPWPTNTTPPSNPNKQIAQQTSTPDTANAPGTSTTCADKMPEMVKKYCLNNNGNGTNSCDSKIQSISITCHDGFVSGYKTANIKQDIAKTFNFSDTSKISLYHSNKQFTAVDTTPPTGTISGIVHDTNNQPIPGATVAVVGTTNATTTDNYGKYTLKNVANGSKIEFEYLGYETQVLDAKPQMDTVKLSEGVNIQAVEVGSKTLGTKCSEEILAQLNAESGEWAKDKQTNETYCEIKCPSTHTKRTGTYSVTARSTTSTQRYKCFEKLTECPAADKKKLEDAGASETGLKHNTEICIALECKCGYTLTDGKCIAWPSTGMACTNDTKPKMPSNASAATMACNANGHAYCRVTACNDNYVVNSDETECTSERGDPCQSGDANAKRAEYKKDKKTKKLICVIKECVDGYDVNKDGTQCVPECECGQEYNESTNKCVPWTDTACNDTQKPKLPSHATSGEKKCNGKRAYCEVTACDDGFKVSDDKKSCTNVRGDECDATAIDKNATAGKYKKSNGEMTCVIQECARGFEPNKSGTKCVAKNVLSEEESQKKIDELRDNAQKMKDKEQSTENKLLGAAGIGATGIGGMMLASGMAEQNADADAETAMKAYLATFHCNYGGGKNIPGGTENVELPGGNELIALYTEYVNLANDLKARKADLGMQPGIESEAILESATSGLYDDVAVGKTSGAYVSLARALMDPEGEDAKLWAEQKDKTAQQIKTGAITAGVGAAGSLIGNLAINSGKNKQNKVDEILNKYNKLKKPFDNLEEKVKQVTPETKPCPSDANGSAHPNCTCRDNSKVYNPNNATCEACTGGRINVENQCKCPENLPLWDESGGKCVAKPQKCTPQCTPTEGSHLVLDKATCQCSCSDGFDLVSGTCQCNNPKSVNESGKCVQVEVKTIEKVLNQTTITNDTTLPASNLFKIGSYELLPGAKTALDSFVSELGGEGISDCEITIVGYTDPVGAVATNQRLSEQRANSVKQYLENKRSGSIKAIASSGQGENNCKCGIKTENMDYSNRDYSVCKDKEDTYPVSGDARYAPCRRVEISAKCKQTSTTGGFVDGLVDGLTGEQ